MIEFDPLAQRANRTATIGADGGQGSEPSQASATVESPAPALTSRDAASPEPPPPAAPLPQQLPAEPLPLEVPEIHEAPALADADVDADAESESRFEVVDAAVSAREGSPAARIVLRRTDDATAPDTAVWWTENRTAIAGEDYAEAAEEEEPFAPGERSRVVFVPLVDDSLPEPTESFLLYFGRYETGGRLQTIGHVNVEIIDDD